MPFDFCALLLQGLDGVTTDGFRLQRAEGSENPLCFDSRVGAGQSFLVRRGEGLQRIQRLIEDRDETRVGAMSKRGA
jgi:hypothetical protein